MSLTNISYLPLQILLESFLKKKNYHRGEIIVAFYEESPLITKNHR